MGRDYILGVKLARLDDLVDLRDGVGRRHGHDGVEVSRGLAVHEIAERVRLLRADERNVGVYRLFKDVLSAVELAHLFALFKVGAGGGGRVVRGDAHTGGAHRLGKCALRHERHAYLALVVCLYRLGVPVIVAAYESFDLSVREQSAKPLIGRAEVVGDDGQLFFVRAHKLVHQLVRAAAESEAAYHYTVAVADVPDGFLCCQ